MSNCGTSTGSASSRRECHSGRGAPAIAAGVAASGAPPCTSTAADTAAALLLLPLPLPLLPLSLDVHAVLSLRRPPGAAPAVAAAAVALGGGCWQALPCPVA